MTILTRAPLTSSPDLDGLAPALWSRWGERVRDSLAAPRPVTMLSAELAGATLTVAALGADVRLLSLWAAAMAVVHASGAPFGERQPVRHALHLGAVTLALSAIVAFFLGAGLDRTETLVATLGMAATAGTVHGVRLIASHRAGTTAPKVVLVGPGSQLPRLLEDLTRPGGLRVDVVGACVTDADPTDPVPDSVTALLPPTVPVTAGLTSILPSVRVMEAEAVVAVPWAGLDPGELRRLEWQLGKRGTDLWVAPGLIDTDPGRTTVLSAGAARLLRVRPSSMHGTRRMLKEIAERATAALALLLLAPLLGCLVVLIRRDGGGSAIFRQQRVGRDGAEFTLLKLRTMVPDAESRLSDLVEHNESDGVLFKLRRDPRVTRVGQVLRRFSLDELPQLWNVVRGEMSLIGPRPPLPREVAGYASDTHRRLAVKPGLTGLWQVSGRSDLSWEESERLDLKYVDNWSLRLDTSILLRTVRAVLSQRGAY